MKAGQSGRCSDREFAFVLDNLVSTIRWGLAASGPLGCHGNHCAPMLAAAVSRERAQGNCWHDRMVWAAFLPQVPGLARVRSTRARLSVPILDLGGFALW